VSYEPKLAKAPRRRVSSAFALPTQPNPTGGRNLERKR